MLDQLRKNASSYIIKVILGLIILSFMLFFGYSQIESQRTESLRWAAQVDGIPIPRQKFEIYLDQSLQNARQSFKDGLPPEFEKILRGNLIQQLVGEKVQALFAGSLGIRVSDTAVAKAIQENPYLQNEGKFSLVQYQEVWLPNYQRQFGENYEEVVRESLTVDRLHAIAEICFSPWQEKTETVTPPALLSAWMEPFREKRRIEVY